MSNENSLFLQTADTGGAPVSNAPTVRTRASAPCPGARANIVTLVSGDDARQGILRPKNLGTCPLHLACYDHNGTFIGAVKLEPGEMIQWFQVPANTQTIKFGCHKSCTGTAILEYDTPYIS